MKKKTTLLASLAIIIICQNYYFAQDTAFLSTKNEIETTSTRLKANSELPTTVTESTIINKNVSLNLESSLYNRGINYNVEKEGFVCLKIYDSSGKEIASVINRKQKSGHYFANFSAFNLSSGIYQYQLSINNKIEPKKLFFIN